MRLLIVIDTKIYLDLILYFRCKIPYESCEYHFVKIGLFFRVKSFILNKIFIGISFEPTILPNFFPSLIWLSPARVSTGWVIQRTSPNFVCFCFIWRIGKLYDHSSDEQLHAKPKKCSCHKQSFIIPDAIIMPSCDDQRQFEDSE